MTDNTSDYTDDLQLALDLADAADAVSLDRFQALDLVIETKPDRTPVTDADKAVERAIRAGLEAARPADVILGEEYGGAGQDAHAHRQWIIDPIDGTANFLRGVPVWGTLIALVVDGVPVVGVASSPALKKRWWASTGDGAWMLDSTGPQPAAARSDDDPQHPEGARSDADPHEPAAPRNDAHPHDPAAARSDADPHGPEAARSEAHPHDHEAAQEDADPDHPARHVSAPQRLAVSKVNDLGGASVSYNSFQGWDVAGHLDTLIRLNRTVWRTRAYGEMWAYMLLAEGLVDAVGEFDLKAYDVAALIPIVREAGGTFTSLDGGDPLWAGDALATNGRLHSDLVTLLDL